MFLKFFEYIPVCKNHDVRATKKRIRFSNIYSELYRLLLQRYYYRFTGSAIHIVSTVRQRPRKSAQTGAMDTIVKGETTVSMF